MKDEIQLQSITSEVHHETINFTLKHTKNFDTQFYFQNNLVCH